MDWAVASKRVEWFYLTTPFNPADGFQESGVPYGEYGGAHGAIASNI